MLHSHPCRDERCSGPTRNVHLSGRQLYSKRCIVFCLIILLKCFSWLNIPTYCDNDHSDDSRWQQYLEPLFLVLWLFMVGRWMSILKDAVCNVCSTLIHPIVHVHSLFFCSHRPFCSYLNAQKQMKNKSHLNHREIYRINGKVCGIGATVAAYHWLITSSWCVYMYIVHQYSTCCVYKVYECEASLLLCCWKSMSFIAHDNSNEMRLLLCIHANSICLKGARRWWRKRPSFATWKFPWPT